MMSVADFCDMCTDSCTRMRIWDMNEDVENEIFAGTMEEAIYSEYADYDVESFDISDNVICLNICTADD